MEDVPWGGAPPSPELGKLLKELNQQYGPDTVSLLSWLSDASIHGGSVLTVSVRINGKETRENTTFLVFQVETGIIFNAQTTDQTGRLLTLWDKIVAKAFSRFAALQVPADGVMIDLLSHCKSFAETDDLSELVDEPGPVEDVKFYFSGDHLGSFLSEQISAQALLAHTQVLVNGTVVNLAFPERGTKTNASATLRSAHQF